MNIQSLASPFAPQSLQLLHSSYWLVRPAFPLRYFHPRKVRPYLWLFASHRDYGSHVHTQRLTHGHAACLPGATALVLRSPRSSSRLHRQVLFRHQFLGSRQVFSGSLTFISFGSYVTDSFRLFLLAHHQEPYSSSKQQQVVCNLHLNGGCGGPFHHHRVCLVAQSVKLREPPWGTFVGLGGIALRFLSSESVKSRECVKVGLLTPLSS